MISPVFKQIGKQIGSLLENQNRSQQSLADELGISKQVMHKIIKGSKAINAAELHAIAQSLLVPLEQLLPRTESGAREELAFGFKGQVTCDETKEEFERIRSAIREMLMLEELLDE